MNPAYGHSSWCAGDDESSKELLDFLSELPDIPRYVLDFGTVLALRKYSVVHRMMTPLQVVNSPVSTCKQHNTRGTRLHSSCYIQQFAALLARRLPHAERLLRHSMSSEFVSNH